MLGQADLFPPDPSLPLRRRVEVRLTTAWDAGYVLKTFHYLHRPRVGRQLNYAIYLDGVAEGVITIAYPMMSAPLEGIPSDELLEFARLYLHRNVPHTATCAIGKVIHRLKADWSKRFPDAKTPRLLVSWSDTERHKGTIYRAANFTWLRRTKGGGAGNTANSKRGARTPHADYDHPKDCWIYWFDRHRGG